MTRFIERKEQMKFVYIVDHKKDELRSFGFADKVWLDKNGLRIFNHDDGFQTRFDAKDILCITIYDPSSNSTLAHRNFE